MPRRNLSQATRRRRATRQLNRAGTDTARVLPRTFIAEAFQDRKAYLRATGYSGPVRGS